MSRVDRPGATAIRRRPPDAVVRAAMLSVAFPLGLLLWMVAAVVAPRLEPTVVLVATAGVAAWGARAGVLATGRRGGLLRRAAVRVVRLVVLLAVAAVVRWVSSGTPLVELLGPPLLVPGVLVVVGFLIGRAIGRIHRRQADPLAVQAVHRSADAASMAAVLAGVVAVTAVTAAAWTSDATWTPARWTLVMWLGVAVAAVLSGRPAVLRARTGTSPAASGGWLRAAVPLVGVVTALTLCVALALSVGLELRLRAALPTLPTWRLDLFDPGTDRAAPPPRTWDESTTGVVWQIVVLVAIVLLLTVGRFTRRRRRPQPHGPGLSLRMLLRSLLGLGRSSRIVADDHALDPVDPPDPVVDVTLAARPPGWVQRVRPRPRDPAAAILHDYRLVQRRLPGGRRRRPSETVLAHAEREHAADLAELADMVCAIRFAERPPTAADAQRSRLLARRLTRG